MTYHVPSRLWLIGLLLPVACSTTTGPGPDPILERCEVDAAPGGPGPNILFIGNSLTFWNDTPGILAGLLEEAAVSFEQIEVMAFPDFGLEDHWLIGTRSAIAADNWDIVILQQGPSATEGRPSLLEFSQRFADDIRAVGGTPALYMVWPSLARFFDFDGVSDSYTTAAELVDGYLYPAGEAWRAAWAQDANLALYDSDGFHPSVMGSYLAALVMFEQIAGLSPTSLPDQFCQPGAGVFELGASTAQILQTAAAEANANFARVPTTVPSP